MSNIEFIDGTVRVGDIAHITPSAYAETLNYITRGDLKPAAYNLEYFYAYSRTIAELIVYELI